MNRLGMLDKIFAHGWRAAIAFDKDGPVLCVRGDFGLIMVSVPVRVEDDHAGCMQNLYLLVMRSKLCMGIMGRA